MDLPLYWKVDGTSLFQAWKNDRENHTVYTATTQMKFKPSEITSRKQQALLRKLSEFSDLTLHPNEIFNTGKHRLFIGRQLTIAELAPSSPLRVRLSPYFLEDGPNKSLSPVLLNGRLYFPGNYSASIQVDPLDIAVVVNGKIVAVTQPLNYSSEKRQADLAALIPENSYHFGKDSLQWVQIIGKKPDFQSITEIQSVITSRR